MKQNARQARPIEQYYTSYNIGQFGITKSADKLVFSTNLNGKSNLFEMRLPKTYPMQFSNNNQKSGRVIIDKEERFIITTFDNDGDENYQLYKVPFSGGIPEKLFETEEGEKHLTYMFTKDNDGLIFTSSKGNPSFMNVCKYTFDSGEIEVLNKGENYSTFFAAKSDDDQLIVLQEFRANTNTRGIILDADGNKHLVTPDDSKVHITQDFHFIGDDKVFFITDYEKDFSYLASFDLKTFEFTEELVIENEELSSIKQDKKNGVLYLVTTKGVQHEFYEMELKSGDVKVIPKPIDLIHQIEVVDSGDLYILGTSARIPNNIFKYDVKAAEWTQLTENKILGVETEELIDPEVVTYKSFDGLEIEAMLFRAEESVANGYTLFWPHGGPQAAEMKFFRALFQVALSRGYNVFTPNFRGSTGYGSEFTKMVEGDWGHGPRLDNIAGVEWLESEGIADSEHLFLIGGSYGGYMALLLHGRHSEKFKAVVDIFGVSNLFTFVESVPDHWKPIMKQWVGDPVEDKEKFIEDSPITYLDTMTKPMLIIQGVKDPRVVKEESDQIVEKLQALDRDVEYLVLEDEGHGFSKKENEIKVYTRVFDFLERHKG